MTDKKQEPPLYLDMGFAEALERFAQTDKKEADELAERAKKKKRPPRDKPPAAGKKRGPT
ncbi:hypothetical protein [Mesorhizobium sp. M0185]|uniref:hypothetical protein n=1 Tax=Mesorhizobium sp. M0185 TaxID=2956907 RepID=UPI003339E53F